MPAKNIALIGYGGFGQFLHHAWRDLDGVRVTAIADEAQEKLRELNNVDTYTDWRKLLDRPDLDLVAVATRPATHAEIATACLEAGKAVLLEKPPAVTLEEAEKLREARDRTRGVLAVDLIMRFNPLLIALRRLSRAGVFGRLRRVDVENYAQDEQLPPGHWFWEPAQSGGILIEHGIHFFDLVHFLQPAAVLSITGLKHDRQPGQEDQVLANVLYEGGLLATHYHSFARPGFFEKTTIKLAYDLADLELHGWIPLRAEVSALVGTGTKATLLAEPLFSLTAATPVAQAADESRPEGWGDPAGNEDGRRAIHSGGVRYEVSEVLTGVLDLDRSKQAVYQDCVRASLLDVLKRLDDPAHRLTAPLEAGLTALKVAVVATEGARR